MTTWLADSDRNWTLEWLGPCDASGFAYAFPISFSWSSRCATAASGVDGYGDAGVATLVLSLENGFKVKHTWQTDIIKSRAGGEQRISRNDTDRESYEGAAYLLDEDPREVRAMLARYAAAGSVFLLGLPHEALALRAPSSGTTVPVFSGPLALADWPRPGQRVVVAYEDEDGVMQFVDAVVQSTTTSTITLNVAPSAPGTATIMPAKAVYLEPQQDFERFESDAELWALRARYAQPISFVPTFASLHLGSVVTNPAFADVHVIAREFGLVGNTRYFYLFNDLSAPDAGYILDNPGDGGFGFFYKGGTTTIGNLATALESSTRGRLAGTWDLSAVIEAGDTLASAYLTGGSDSGDVGTGATIEEYEDHPVWDREIIIDGSIVDGVQAMTQIIDHGGVPYALGTADQADWFRTVALAAGDREDWQWFKLFMSTVRGKQKKFWLATWREDLVYVEHAGSSLTIDRDAGDFTAWWPRQRQHVQVLQADNTVTYAEVTAATAAGATRTLTLSESLSSSPVERISWLELCRWENADEYETTHDQHGFSVSLLARVVP